MKKKIEPEHILKYFPESPKQTKEQKIIRKALNHIQESALAENDDQRFAFINQTIGLLEALLFEDDKDEHE